MSPRFRERVPVYRVSTPPVLNLSSDWLNLSDEERNVVRRENYEGLCELQDKEYGLSLSFYVSFFIFQRASLQ